MCGNNAVIIAENSNEPFIYLDNSNILTQMISLFLLGIDITLLLRHFTR